MTTARRRHSIGLLLLAVAALFLFTGCRARRQPVLPVGVQGYTVSPTLQPIMTRLASEGQRNWVLHLNELAVAALREGDRELARKALDESILQINAVFGTTPEARRARSLFFEEGSKLFKGDSYERAMTFFYRGILYMQEGDFPNARACFRSAALQDAHAEEEQNRADWAIFDYLIGVCEMRLGNEVRARESFALAMENASRFPEGARALNFTVAPITTPTLEMKPTQNLIVITQTGTGPRKIRVGKYGEYQGFERTARGDMRARVAAGGMQPVYAPVVDSVYFQAATRGGRPFDRIAKRKVVFKDASGYAGAAAAGAGYFVLTQSDNSDTAVAALALIAVGGIVTIVSELTKPQADIRQWTSLPDSIGLFQAMLPEGPAAVQVMEPSGVTTSADVEIPGPGQGLVVVMSFPGPKPFLLTPPISNPPGAPR